MTFRERHELWEKAYLSQFATLSSESVGRLSFEQQCDIRTIFQRDRDRIIHCKSFRRLKHKTQVFLSPEGDHYRTRLTHTLEVAQIARTIARALRLNEDLTEAIALGHDLGHTPFGHAGERALNEISSCGFKHNEQSLRVVELIEKKGQGLNLTYEVKDGIVNHQTKGEPCTLEGKIVRLSDKIAYINHDIDDAIRGGIIKEEQIPTEYTGVLGDTTKARLNCLIHDIISNSDGRDDIIMSKHIEEAMIDLRKYMFTQVYTNPKAKSEEVKAIRLVEALFEYYMKNSDKMADEFSEMAKYSDSLDRVVCDYIAGMTDNYAIAVFRTIYEPKSWKVL